MHVIAHVARTHSPYWSWSQNPFMFSQVVSEPLNVMQWSEMSSQYFHVDVVVTVVVNFVDVAVVDVAVKSGSARLDRHIFQPALVVEESELHSMVPWGTTPSGPTRPWYGTPFTVNLS